MDIGFSLCQEILECSILVVLILILMDIGFSRPLKRTKTITHICLNPYSNGYWFFSEQLSFIGDNIAGLNPYSNGYWFFSNSNRSIYL